ncbi:MAG: ComF family protein [Bacteroidota bacterium]
MLGISMFKQISPISNSFLHLLFPEKCIHCHTELILKESVVCLNCLSTISYTFFENYTEQTKMDKLFWGKILLHKTFSLYYFEENTVVQSILHTLKYENNPQIGIEFGRKIGERIMNLEGFQDIDALIPVPIHPKKKFSRGYNQAEMIAKGISEITTIPIQSTEVKKLKHTQSQTKKSMWERWTTSENTFSSLLTDNSLKHIALIDDVLTTGATLERLAKTILDKNPNVKISLITLAITK